MRTTVVILFMLFIIVYAQRDWFIPLCAVIVFTALKVYPGLPNPLEAKGMNHWSVMVLGVTLGWIVWRVTTRPSWNIPRGWLIVIVLYMIAESVAVVRLCSHLDEFRERASLVRSGYAFYTIRAVLIDCVYGPVRYMFLGFLLMDGARSRRRLLLGLCAVAGAVLIYALIVNKEIPLSGLSGGGMQFRRRISKWTGRHPNDLARVFVSMFWVAVVFLQFKLGSWKLRAGVLAAAAVILLGLAHTQSRGGWLGFAFVGLVLGLLLRSKLVLGTLVVTVAAAFVFAPGIVARLMVGFGSSASGGPDLDEVTAGRNVIWAAAMSGIEQSPLVGHGMYGHVMSEALDESLNAGGGELHPHNAYLETILDHGILGAGARLGPLLYVLLISISLARRRSDPVLRMVGVVGIAWASTTLAMGSTGQHFGLTENLFTFWCVAGLVARAATFPETETSGLSKTARRPLHSSYRKPAPINVGRIASGGELGRA